MVKIYKLKVNSSNGKHPYVSPDPEAFNDGFLQASFNGPLPDEWKPPKFVINRKSGKLADVIGGWRAPLFSERAVELFLEIAPNCAEYKFFTDIKKNPYYVINVLSVMTVDILDKENSEYAYGGDGEIGQIYRYVIKSDILGSLPPVFRITFGHYLDSTILVTDIIPRAVVNANLTGFSFWDPNNPTEMKDLYLGKDLNVYPGVLP